MCVFCWPWRLWSAHERLAQGPAPGGAARNDIAGDWLAFDLTAGFANLTMVSAEDQPHRVPGPELGDYTGLPINAAARQKAEAWNATILSQPERQTQAHPVQYSMRGPGPNLRIMKVLDPITQQMVAYTIAGTYGRADRVIWMDGRLHPSDYAEHTWDGFSTGAWENGQLTVTTTHMKQGVVQRNGAPTSPYGVMSEHFFRHGLYSMSFVTIDDPIFLEEPLVRTQTWSWAPNTVTAWTYRSRRSTSSETSRSGGCPFWPLGVQHREFAEVNHIPFKATQGGKESLYPENQQKIAEFTSEEAAAKEAAPSVTSSIRPSSSTRP